MMFAMARIFGTRRTWARKAGRAKEREERYNLERKRSTRTGYTRTHLLDRQLHTKKGGNRKALRDLVKTFDKDNEGDFEPIVGRG